MISTSEALHPNDSVCAPRSGMAILIFHLFGHGYVNPLTTLPCPPTLSNESSGNKSTMRHIRDARLVLGDATVPSEEEILTRLTAVPKQRRPVATPPSHRRYLTSAANGHSCLFGAVCRPVIILLSSLHDQLVGARLMRREDPRSVFRMTGPFPVA